MVIIDVSSDLCSSDLLRDPSLGSPDVSDLLRDYLTVAIFGLVGVGLVALLLGIGGLLRPTRPQAGKYVNYESGVDPVGSGWGQSQVRYYIYALLFVMFDVEAVFIFPFATRVDAYEWRSEERRVGKECVRRCRSGWAP